MPCTFLRHKFARHFSLLFSFHGWLEWSFGSWAMWNDWIDWIYLFIGVVLFGMGCGGGGGWFSSFVGLNVYGTSKKYAYHCGILVAHFQCLNVKKSCLIDNA
jgi:hypothetical protein